MPFDGFDRHAPEGYAILMQFFRGESRERALAVASKASVETDLKILPGHFDGLGIFQPYGWMVFEPIRRRGVIR